MKKQKQSDKVKEPSVEYQNFENGLRQVLSVSKEELDRRDKAEREAKAKQKKQAAKP